MATVTAFIRNSKNEKNKSVNIRFRLRDGRDFQVFHTSEILVFPDKWDAVQQKIKARSVIHDKDRYKVDNTVNERKNIINQIYTEKGKTLTSDLLNIEIEKVLHPEKYPDIEKKQSFFDTFNEFLTKRKLSDVREKHFMVLFRALQRFELYQSELTKKPFKLELNAITGETITQLENFLRNEYTLYDKYKHIYDQFPAITNTYRKVVQPQPRGTNTINAIFNKLRAFFNWCYDNDKMTARPFKNYERKPDIYGTPIYITIAERNQIYNTDFSHNPNLEIQRDIFVFQCLVGCRVSDLYSFTKSNIIDIAIEYYPRKTKDEKPVVVRVPLNPIAQEILNKYADFERNTLFPFISQQNYNYAIKDIFKFAGITRLVTVLNPTTKEPDQRPINEIASSHLARRCFVGNLYKQVKDPNLVGALSGHTEGSKAFARYRDIDEDMKKELVNLLM